MQEIEEVLQTTCATFVSQLAATVTTLTADDDIQGDGDKSDTSELRRKIISVWAVPVAVTSNYGLLEHVLRMLAEKLLPRSMVPGRFAFTTELPSTTSGKVLKLISFFSSCCLSRVAGGT